jgi:uncharacterized glyoxalase superfamily protein PhnB
MLTLLLRCKDKQETRAFYASMLGFDVRGSAEATLTAEKFGARLIFTEADLWQSAPKLSGTIYFIVADVAAYHAAIKDKVSLAWPLQDMPYGSSEFGVNDCNGYCLAFQQAKR